MLSRCKKKKILLLMLSLHQIIFTGPWMSPSATAQKGSSIPFELLVVKSQIVYMNTHLLILSGLLALRSPRVGLVPQAGLSEKQRQPVKVREECRPLGGL